MQLSWWKIACVFEGDGASTSTDRDFVRGYKYNAFADCASFGLYGWCWCCFIGLRFIIWISIAFAFTDCAFFGFYGWCWCCFIGLRFGCPTKFHSC